MYSKKTFTEFISILLNHPKNQRVSSTVELILKANIILIQKANISHTHKHTQTHTHTDTHINIHDEYKFRNPQQGISKWKLIIPKRSVYHDQAEFTPRMQG